MARRETPWFFLQSGMEAGLVFLILWLVRRVSWPTTYRIGTILGHLMYFLHRSRRNIAIGNVTMALGDELSPEGVRQVVLHTYVNFLKSICEFIRIPTMAPSEIRSRVELVGLEHIQTGLAAGKGVILMTAHFGNWELVGARLVVEGFPVCVIARPTHNRMVADLMQSLRGAAGLQVIMKLNAMREALRSLRRNEILGILPDQHAGQQGILIEFFGRPASTWQSVALLAMRTGAPIVPVYAVRQLDNTHRAEIHAPVPVSQTGDAETDARVTTERTTRILEDVIRRYPDHWFWIHKRWKGER